MIPTFLIRGLPELLSSQEDPTIRYSFEHSVRWGRDFAMRPKAEPSSAQATCQGEKQARWSRGMPRLFPIVIATSTRCVMNGPYFCSRLKFIDARDLFYVMFIV